MNRRSGRTNRMLLKALQAFLDGADTVVIAHLYDVAWGFARTVKALLHAMGIPAEGTRDEIHFNNFRMRFKGCGQGGDGTCVLPHEKVFFDHHAVETMKRRNRDHDLIRPTDFDRYYQCDWTPDHIERKVTE